VAYIVSIVRSRRDGITDGGRFLDLQSCVMHLQRFLDFIT
jgi:hypothetical protein